MGYCISSRGNRKECLGLVLSRMQDVLLEANDADVRPGLKKRRFRPRDELVSCDGLDMSLRTGSRLEEVWTLKI